MVSNRRVFAILGALALASSGIAQSTVDRVEVQKNSDGTVVTIEGSQLSNPKQTLALNGSATIFEFSARLKAKPMRVAVNRDGLKTVQCGWFTAKPPRVRVTLWHEQGKVPSVSVSGSVVTATFANTARTVKKDTDSAAMDNAIAMLSGTPPETKLSGPTKSKTLIEAVEIEFPETVPPLDGTPTPSSSQATKTKASIGNSATMAKPTAAKKDEKFPETVPPITDLRGSAIAGSSLGAGQVSLDFTNTDVMAILKALAMQTGVNIVASPDVSPSDKPLKITLSLTRVGVEEALNLLTAMAGLRYARVGNTYVVTQSDNFAAAMRQVANSETNRYKTRVVSLKSGEALVIKDSALKAMPPDGLNGWYEIIVPSVPPPSRDSGAARNAVNVGMDPTMMNLLQEMNSKLPNPQGGATQPGGKTATERKDDQGQEASLTSSSRQKAYYLLLIGEERRLDSIEKYVQDLDSRIIASFSNATATDVSTIVVPIYSGQQERIMSMISRLLATNPRSEEFSISSTSVKELPEFEMSTTVLLLMGPSSDLQNIRQFAAAIDEDMCKAAGIEIPASAEDSQRYYEVVALNYIEPKLAEYDLKSRVRGLHVTVLPDVVNPTIKGEAETEKQAGPQDQNQPATSAKTDEQKKKIGGEPMKLMLRGTRDQIRQAKEYLAMVDIAPKQVAIEMRVMDLTKEDLLKAGIDWNLFTGGVVKIIRLNNSQPTAPNPPRNLVSGSIRGRDVTASLDEITTKTNLIARPNAMAMDGRETELFVGDVIRYIQSIQSTQQGVTVTTGEIQVGVRLQITPRVGSNNSIVLDLQPTVSFLRGFTDVPGGGQLPQTSDRTVRSTISIGTGETIAIGGLIQDQDTKELSGLPILKDLPILGWLFRKTTNTRKRSEVVIFLTAQVIDGVANSTNVPLPIKQESNDKKKSDKSGGQ